MLKGFLFNNNNSNMVHDRMTNASLHVSGLLQMQGQKGMGKVAKVHSLCMSEQNVHECHIGNINLVVWPFLCFQFVFGFSDFVTSPVCLHLFL